jgi:hypothetical protein
VAWWRTSPHWPCQGWGGRRRHPPWWLNPDSLPSSQRWQCWRAPQDPPGPLLLVNLSMVTYFYIQLWS